MILDKYLQVIATSVEDCIIAEDCGANSIELCSAIEFGGLTPSVGLMRMAKSACKLNIYALLRPRPGGSVYSSHEIDVMIEDAKALADAGCNGFTFAILDSDGDIHWSACRELKRHVNGYYCTFHRAFDLLPDPQGALSVLEDLEFSAVLTSGRQATAMDGAAEIRAMVEQVQEYFDIVPAGGINASNVRALVEATGCRTVHGSFSHYVDDPSLEVLPAYRFGSHPERMRMLDGEQVTAVRAILDELEPQR